MQQQCSMTTGAAPVADEVRVEDGRVPAEQGDRGGPAERKVPQLVALGVRLADLGGEPDGAHLHDQAPMLICTDQT